VQMKVVQAHVRAPDRRTVVDALRR
jgi:hypothetical protein